MLILLVKCFSRRMFYVAPQQDNKNPHTVTVRGSLRFPVRDFVAGVVHCPQFPALESANLPISGWFLYLSKSKYRVTNNRTALSMDHPREGRFFVFLKEIFEKLYTYMTYYDIIEISVESEGKK